VVRASWFPPLILVLRFFLFGRIRSAVAPPLSPTRPIRSLAQIKLARGSELHLLTFKGSGVHWFCTQAENPTALMRRPWHAVTTPLMHHPWTIAVCRLPRAVSHKEPSVCDLEHEPFFLEEINGLSAHSNK
jgi:hypothetical protein